MQNFTFHMPGYKGSLPVYIVHSQFYCIWGSQTPPIVRRTAGIDSASK